MERRPLVAVGYGPRCVPVMQLTEAAANLCDLLWLVDGSLPEMHQMTELLNRFGPVINVDGLGIDELMAELAPPYRPDGIVTYLDANMTRYARLAEEFGLPFHSYPTAAALTDKAEQRSVLRDAGLDSPACMVIGQDLSDGDLVSIERTVGWPAVLKPRSAQGSHYTFFVKGPAQLSQFLTALGPTRPEMVLETYLDDDPSRSAGPFADYVSVESIVSSSVVSHLAITGRFPLAENFRETGFFIPAALGDADQEAALELASSAIAALKVTTGCLHTEVKFTLEGPKVIEVNGRVGGGVPEMLERAAGLHLLEMTLRLALGERMVFDGPVVTDRIGYRFFLQPPGFSATVEAISGIDAISDYPGVDSVSVHQGPGAELDWKDGSRNHIVAIVGSASDYEELRAVDRLLNQEVTVTYANVSHF